MVDFAPLLEALSVQFRLVLLSNVDRYYFEAIRPHPPKLEHFALQLVSYEMGFSKPSEEAFRAAISAAQAPAQECYFVDDKAENIAAALKLGIKGHVFTTTQVCRAALTKYGVLESRGVMPNPSLKRSANGRPPSPGWLYAVHFHQPGLGFLPSSPA